MDKKVKSSGYEKPQISMNIYNAQFKQDVLTALYYLWEEAGKEKLFWVSATQVNAWILKNEKKDYCIELEEPLSGHIDILQQRFTKIHILDYKPDAKKSDKTSAEQLFLYELAFSKRTGIPLRKITSAYFDQNNYFQLQQI